MTIDKTDWLLFKTSSDMYFSFIHDENKLPDKICVQMSYARRV